MSKIIKKLEPANIAELHQAIQTALRSVGDTYGVEFSIKGAIFKDDSVTSRITMTPLFTKTGPSRNKLIFDNYLKYANQLGLKKEYLLKRFRIKGRGIGQIVGLSVDHIDTPIVVELQDGKKILYTEAALVSALKHNEVK